METLTGLLDLFLHLDRYLAAFVADYGVWVYGLLFLIVFCETGLVVLPFLPGDSLLFVAGTLAGAGMLEPLTLVFGLAAAAILGDTVNYSIGKRIGPAAFRGEHTRLFKREHLIKTQLFYERHGGKTIIIARFLPIIRTFAPFIAGVAEMAYSRFLAYNMAGGAAWVGAFVTAGFFFGDIPVVRDNLTAVILGIIVISLLPGIIHFLRHKRSA